jgi:hypothetical protein
MAVPDQPSGLWNRCSAHNPFLLCAEQILFTKIPQLSRNYFSTRTPVSGFIQALGNSERWKMTGNEDNVGFLATGSGVKQFQLSLRGWFVLKARRFSPELRSTKHTIKSRASAAAPRRKQAFSIHRTRFEARPHRACPKVFLWGVSSRAFVLRMEA